MAEFRRLPTQQELQQILFMQGLQPQSTQQILQQNLAPQTIKPIPENVFQKIAGGARAAGEFVNRAGTAADVAKLFPGYTGQTQVNIPTSFNFAPKQAPTGEIIPQGMQTQQVNVGQLLQAIKPADVLGISGAERAYSDIGIGKAPKPLDVVDTLALGAGGLAAGKAAVKGVQATKGLPVGMSIQDVSKAGGLLQEAPRSPLGFYSALEETALNLQRNKGAGQAFLNDLQKGPNVKSEEIKWIGLDDYLKNKPNVTKQEVQDYIANNRVDVQEVQSPVGESIGTYDYRKWQLPGGENYREILLTMPSNMSEYNKYTKALREKYGEGGFANLPLTDIERARLDKFYAAEDIDPYKSTHFPQENILAHLRVNDRVDADGKKMLLIEEVQSDWHQAGREKGYVTPEVRQKQEEINKKLDELYFQKLNLRDEQKAIQSKDKNFMFNQDWLDVDKKLTEIEKQQVKLKDQALGFGAIPDAPFKDTWYQLALKRAIQHAAENGYDRIGLTTGSRQAARFDLSKQVDNLLYSKNPDGTYRVSAQVQGRGQMLGEAIPESKLADYVGKEVAERMAKGMGNKTEVAGDYDPVSMTSSKKYMTELSGDGLKIGGEGMKKYYDEIYPKFLDKYGKKWNAKVGETSLGGTGAAFDYYKSGNMFDVIDGNNNVVGRFNSAQEAARQVDKLNAEGTETVRYLDVTPEMKASVSKGQPLFQVGIGAGGGLLGAQQERK